MKFTAGRNRYGSLHSFFLSMSFFLLCITLCIIQTSCRTISVSSSGSVLPSSMVIFSFDDGPNAHDDTTARLLDVLKKYQIHALFSLLGDNVEHYPELVKRIYDEGHYIVNHGYYDKWAKLMSEDEFRENLFKGEAAINAALGIDLYPKLYRPHGGFYSPGQERIIQEAGYTLVPSTVRVYDAAASVKKRHTVMRKLLRQIKAKNGGIIMLHDERGSHARKEIKLEKHPDGRYNRSWIPELVEDLIPVLLDRGYILTPDAFYDIIMCHFDEEKLNNE